MKRKGAAKGGRLKASGGVEGVGGRAAGGGVRSSVERLRRSVAGMESGVGGGGVESDFERGWRVETAVGSTEMRSPAPSRVFGSVCCRVANGQLLNG